MNVLPVLDRLILGQRDAWGIPDDDLVQARAAVAELIEAVRDMRATKPTYSIAYGQAEQRVDAALARVQGEGQ